MAAWLAAARSFTLCPGDGPRWPGDGRGRAGRGEQDADHGHRGGCGGLGQGAIALRAAPAAGMPVPTGIAVSIYIMAPVALAGCRPGRVVRLTGAEYGQDDLAAAADEGGLWPLPSALLQS
jgi:hypothetical protein